MSWSDFTSKLWSFKIDLRAKSFHSQTRLTHWNFSHFIIFSSIWNIFDLKSWCFFFWGKVESIKFRNLSFLCHSNILLYLILKLLKKGTIFAFFDENCYKKSENFAKKIYRSIFEIKFWQNLLKPIKFNNLKTFIILKCNIVKGWFKYTSSYAFPSTLSKIILRDKLKTWSLVLFCFSHQSIEDQYANKRF